MQLHRYAQSRTQTPPRRNWPSDKCLFNSHTPELWQWVYAYEDSDTCTHLHTEETCNHIDCHGHTQVRITPDSGLRELIKRKNPDDISSPLESTRNDNRIGPPMEMSLLWRARTHAHARTAQTLLHKNAWKEKKQIWRGKTQTQAHTQSGVSLLVGPISGLWDRKSA